MSARRPLGSETPFLRSPQQYTPTTVLVDSEGNTVGEAIIGGKENLAEFYTACINSALTDMGKDEISIDTESEAE